MPGLLGRNTSARGLLGGSLGAMNMGATPEALRRKQEEERRASLLARAQPAPQPERRGEPGFLTYLMGGRNALTSERTYRAEQEQRRQAEAMRPQMEAQRQQILGSITDPRERALFMTDPAAWAENVGYQFRPRTLAPGSVERLGGETVGAAPIVERFDDRFGVFDPLNPQGDARYSTPRGATRDEETDRLRVEQDARQFDSRLALDRDKLAVDAEVGLGGLGIAREELGLKRDEVSREEQERQRTELAASEEAKATADNMATALTRARDYIGSAGAYQFLNPLNRQGRANLQAQIDTLQGNLTLDKLMEMKANSPNGASGMGALSEQEGRLLASTVASLSADMTPQELERSFTIIDGLVAKMRQPAPAAAGGSRQRARNPQTGEVVEWNGSAWVPI